MRSFFVVLGLHALVVFMTLKYFDPTGPKFLNYMHGSFWGLFFLSYYPMDIAVTAIMRFNLISIILYASLARRVAASCECGYTTRVGNETAVSLFTDLLESDFFHIHNMTLGTDWRRQNFSVSAELARGPYGMNFTLTDIVSNPIANRTLYTGPGIHGGDPGVILSVGGGNPMNGLVPAAEIDSTRVDLLHGSYRALMKLTPTSGTCAAFFWYHDDSQEIDMEFLSSQFDFKKGIFPVNLVMQSQESVRAGYNAANSGNYIVANLPFDPTNGFHEYRIDFTDVQVVFYGDGHQLGHMSGSALPTSPGHMILTQWSNGNPLWSGGPPVQQAEIAVGYVKAYFNSTDPIRHSDWALRCHDATLEGATCGVPDFIDSATTAGAILDNGTFFFSHQHNMTLNQTVYHENGAAGFGEFGGSIRVLLLLVVLVVASATRIL